LNIFYSSYFRNPLQPQQQVFPHQTTHIPPSTSSSHGPSNHPNGGFTQPQPGTNAPANITSNPPPPMDHGNPSQTGQYRPLNVKDALSYLDQVKIQFGDQQDVYNRFLDIMKDFKSQR